MPPRLFKIEDIEAWEKAGLNPGQALGPVSSQFGAGVDSVDDVQDVSRRAVKGDGNRISKDDVRRRDGTDTGAQNAHKGLFFPAGLNGVIK